MQDHDQKNTKQEGEQIMEEKIQKLLSEIDAYKEAIDDARNALAAAEQELDAELDAAIGQDL